MNLATVVQKEIKKQPPRIVVHGIHGVGKSYFAAKSDLPIFLITEDGLTNIKVDHFPLVTNLETVWEYMGMIIKDKHQYKTFVVDTIDWLEKLIWQQVCIDNNVKSIEDIGYAKGYIYALRYWEKFLTGLNKIRDKGISIILLAHNEIKPFNPPDSDIFDRYQIKLHKKAAALVEEWADCVLFASFKTFLTQDKTGKTKATGSGERVLNSANKPAWRAKTRYTLPEQLPLDIKKLMQHITGEIKNG